MTSLKRTFYMLLGFTFPFFWAYHAAGFADFLFKPIQLVTSTKSAIWPSFITAFLLYTLLIIVIEFVFRPKRHTFTPEWPDLSQIKQKKDQRNFLHEDVGKIAKEKQPPQGESDNIM